MKYSMLSTIERRELVIVGLTLMITGCITIYGVLYFGVGGSLNISSVFMLIGFISLVLGITMFTLSIKEE